MLLHECFSHFLNLSNVIKSRKVSHLKISKRIHKKTDFRGKNMTAAVNCKVDIKVAFLSYESLLLLLLVLSYEFFVMACIFVYFNFSVAIVNKKKRAIRSCSLQQVHVLLQLLFQCNFIWPDTNHFLRSLGDEWTRPWSDILASYTQPLAFYYLLKHSEFLK